MRFADPLFLLLLVVPAVHAWRLWRSRRRPPAEHLALPPLAALAAAPPTARVRWRRALPALRVAALALLVAALARPQAVRDVREIRLRSRNVMFALDISSSMKATDFQPGNRFQVARTVLADFVQRREGDLLGLVIFAGRAFLQAPLTPDPALLADLLGRVDIGQLPDGTAIGTALAMALAQLKDLPPTASVIVLVTDGANNTGQLSPFAAAEAARALGVRIHAVGLSAVDTAGRDDGFIWREGRTPDRLTHRDEAALRRIAERTGGKYFRATDPEGLERIMREIDPLEKVDVRIGETRDWRELYPFLVLPAVLLLALELGLGATWLRGLP